MLGTNAAQPAISGQPATQGGPAAEKHEPKDTRISVECRDCPEGPSRAASETEPENLPSGLDNRVCTPVIRFRLCLFVRQQTHSPLPRPLLSPFVHLSPRRPLIPLSSFLYALARTSPAAHPLVGTARPPRRRPPPARTETRSCLS